MNNPPHSCFRHCRWRHIIFVILSPLCNFVSSFCNFVSCFFKILLFERKYFGFGGGGRNFRKRRYPRVITPKDRFVTSKGTLATPGRFITSSEVRFAGSEGRLVTHGKDSLPLGDSRQKSVFLFQREGSLPTGKFCYFREKARYPCCIHALHQTAQDNAHLMSALAYNTILEGIYADDLLRSVPPEEELQSA